MSKSYPVDQGTDWMKDTTPPCRWLTPQPSRLDPAYCHPVIVDLSSPVVNVARSSEVRPQAISTTPNTFTASS